MTANTKLPVAACPIGRTLIFRTGLLLAVVCGSVSCNSGNSPNNGNSGAGNAAADTSLAAFNKDTLAADIQVLSSDDFQGRRPFTPGETKTIDYLVKAYTNLGLEPGNGNSYTQDVPLVEISPASPPVLAVHSPKGEIALKNMSDFVVWTEKPDSVDIIDKSDIEQMDRDRIEHFAGGQQLRRRRLQRIAPGQRIFVSRTRQRRILILLAAFSFSVARASG